ncbi:helix-turn-helix domain-containing protein [Bacillus sp. NTK034]|uniref:helix-turn-helix domain-containing protein n=1 Tax=Bacillus sp. NTK034 TaxID=2802176 RepID=UPI001A8CC152|nr:helix-turn-helix transcriptional regulator [Bacillus sp. NTK034]MBN8200522.1 helix-turn-helix transcriptional regulator [Bacillus sp. NTK034]
MEELDIEVGLKLKKLREEKGYSMREVGERIGIDHSYVGKIEKGKIPSLNTLKRLCNLYDISVSSLFGDEVEKPKPLKDIGVEWMTFIDKMEKRELSPKEIEDIMEALKALKKL